MGKATEKSTENMRDARYWLYEEPIIYDTGKNAIRYYPKAGKIQFALPDYIEAKTFYGKLTETRKPGKLAALDLDALREDPETLKWLLGIFQGLL